MTKRRQHQIAGRIHNVLSQSLTTHCRDQRLGNIWLTAVEVSADLTICKIYFRLREEPVSIKPASTKEHIDADLSSTEKQQRIDDALGALRHSQGFLRSQLAQEIHIKRIPQLHFYYDSSPERGQRIMELIAKS
ncbi:MAG: ribosome-binding factor A [Proteobacteria bacterium]|nr:ribosome-binding factor A [Pseudomonadota bacterium]